MTFFTVLRIENHDDEVDFQVFKKIYRTQASAIQAVESDALDHFNALVDPNDGETHVFPGVQEFAANKFEYADENYPDHGITYELHEMEIEK